ncbi:PASTA domain-containing protein [Kribbella sp. NPDC059898]|uniref:PASTA domain-containing protein n=1 Tax=Kribbella sp. NPDC059898 TaxID=3346995 RepID=UPI003664E9B5
MTDLPDLLERTAARTPVGPPPLEALHTGAKRRRRRRTATTVGAAAAAVGAVISATALLTPPPQTTPAAPPPTRLVGIGHAAIAVPATWGTNQLTCATPRVDTVVVDLGAITYCAMPRPAGVESVQLGQGAPRMFSFHADETLEIDGVPAQRQRTTCSADWNHVQVCSGAVWIPSRDVWFWAQSSTRADEVDRILRRIVLVPDRVAVPLVHTYDRAGRWPTADAYIAELTRLGLKPALRTVRSPNYATGTIHAVSPGPGTMLAPGATVTVTYFVKS